MRLTLAGAIYVTLVVPVAEFLIVSGTCRSISRTSLLIIVVVTMDFMAQCRHMSCRTV